MRQLLHLGFDEGEVEPIAESGQDVACVADVSLPCGQTLQDDEVFWCHDANVSSFERHANRTLERDRRIAKRDGRDEIDGVELGTLQQGKSTQSQPTELHVGECRNDRDADRQQRLSCGVERQICDGEIRVFCFAGLAIDRQSESTKDRVIETRGGQRIDRSE
ncbi:MAG TPA: hypothetical protein VGM90_01785 [Kofleriaceae bacterium]